MKKLLVTGGTVFVSRRIAEYYISKGYDVYVLNRNTRPQPAYAKLIQADRNDLGELLRGHHFDAVIDVTAYTAAEVGLLLDALESCDTYILISSSAVYPEYCVQPFTENTQTGANKFWGKYGTDKIEAEQTLLKRADDGIYQQAYILRPPYLYGAMNNVYREAFVFDCALRDRKFYIPVNGEMKLQFFHVQDLCRFTEILLKTKPTRHIFNVGNKEAISVRKWVELCYQAVGKKAEFVNVFCENLNINQRKYFSFSDYEYFLDVSEQYALMPDVKPLYDGLQEAYEWYKDNSDMVDKRPYFEFIDQQLINLG